jgi:MoaA/NifB/PqqE/SkfB family radical SAM enzyme
MTSAVRPSPYLHVDADRIYDPLTDRTLLPQDEMYALMRTLLESGVSSDPLERDGWTVRDGEDLSRRHHLKIVSLETMTTCNQKCYFCPVSVAPREDESMPDSMFERLLGELQAIPTIESVFLQSYNEPTLDKRFVDQVKALFKANLPVAVLTNASGLTPAKVDAIMAAGQMRFICVNLSTMDRERYQAERGGDHLNVVLRNLEYVRDKPIAAQMNMVVLGRGDATHDRDFEQIRAHFAGSRFDVQRHVVMDRAGWLEVGLKTAQKHKRLAGCDNLGSRPLQHLHITPAGKCVLCCEDYDENYIVGDLNKSTIAEVLEGEPMAQMRRWIYGVDEAPEDFICRSCIFARTK